MSTSLLLGVPGRLRILVNRVTPTRFSKLDLITANVDADLSDIIPQTQVQALLDRLPKTAIDELNRVLETVPEKANAIARWV